MYRIEYCYVRNLPGAAQPSVDVPSWCGRSASQTSEVSNQFVVNIKRATAVSNVEQHTQTFNLHLVWTGPAVQRIHISLTIEKLFSHPTINGCCSPFQQYIEFYTFVSRLQNLANLVSVTPDLNCGETLGLYRLQCYLQVGLRSLCD